MVSSSERIFVPSRKFRRLAGEVRSLPKPPSKWVEARRPAFQRLLWGRGKVLWRCVASELGLVAFKHLFWLLQLAEPERRDESSREGAMIGRLQEYFS